MTTFRVWCCVMMVASMVSAREYHVSVEGDDGNAGSAGAPFRTISKAADVAQPGDVVTVHGGTYRERVTPPRGGTSDAERIVYRAATGEKVVIKGSEVVKGWEKVQNDTWKVTLANGFFGDFNPHSDVIHGDWFNGKGRDHHTGAVYLNGHWLIEGARLDDVLTPIGQASGYAPGDGEYLLNVAWLHPKDAERVPAAAFAAQRGIQTADCSEGGQCIGWVNAGDWVRYERVDFGPGTEQMVIRAASVTNGGTIEMRLDAPDGELLGSCRVPNTGGWQSWRSFESKIKPVEGIRTLCLVFRGPKSEPSDVRLWFAQVDDANTTIWAQFADVNPNEAEVEINVRQTVFYPAKPGIDYLTVQGFTMMHAATPWAPPTAEQIGLIGTHWSKGWIIEDCDIRYSTCVGITLGKYGDQWDNTSANTAEGYVKTIERALKNGWSKDNIGHHVVRNNKISHCEQAGLVGSLGAVFSTISDNDIHDIHIRQLFTGAEMAGIKIHAAIDCQISRNHIYRTCRGIWLDWMAQGTRVTRNLLHDNATSEDLFVEVNHGPFLVDNNIFLSGRSLRDWSQGGAYVHNLFAGRIEPHSELNRETPYHKAHSTEVAGLLNIAGGDDRFYNNVFVYPSGLDVYNDTARPVYAQGNLYLNGAQPHVDEAGSVVRTALDPAIRVTADDGAAILQITIDPAWQLPDTSLVTTERLGLAAVPQVAYENADGTPLVVDTDYLGNRRSTSASFPGPFAKPHTGELTGRVW